MASDEQQLAVKQLLIELFRLRMQPEEIESGAPLFGEGLGLDSVDAIELVTGLEAKYGVQVADEEQSREIFVSVDTLASFLVAQGALK